MTTKTNRRTAATAEKEWRAHCAEMNRLYEIKAAELLADGWTIHDQGRRFGGEYFTKPGHEPVIIVRQPGSAHWYTTPKIF